MPILDFANSSGSVGIERRSRVCSWAIIPALLGLAGPAWASEGAGPATVYVEGLTEHTKQYAFYVYRPQAVQGANPTEPYWAPIESGRTPEPGETGVRVSSPPRTGVLGELKLVAVSRDMAEKAPAGDPAWFQGRPNGVVPVVGTIEVVPLRQSLGQPVLRYRLEKTAEGFTLTLLNPERLAREQEPDSAPASAKKADTRSQSTLVWVALAAAVVVLVACAVVWWLRIAKGPAETGSATDPSGQPRIDS